MSRDQTRVDLGEDLIGLLLKKEIPIDESALDKTQIIIDPEFQMPIENSSTPEVTEGPVFFIPLDQQDAALPEPNEKINSILNNPETDSDFFESAEILISEGLLEEAKKCVFRVRARNPSHPKIRLTLDKIEELELAILYKVSHKKKKNFKPIEDVTTIIKQLNKDLGIFESKEIQATEMWVVETKEVRDLRGYLDLGLAFFEMGCYEDAIREFRKIIRQVRLEKTALGPEGVSAVHLVGLSLIELGRAFEAKHELKQVLAEPELTSDEQLLLMYTAAEAELNDGDATQAKSWFEKILKIDKNFRDVDIRIREIKT